MALGPWFLFPATGTIQRQTNPVLAAGLTATGWVGYPTQAAAQAAASSGIFKNLRSAADAPLSAAQAGGKLLTNLTNRGTWIRIGEGIVGILLILVAAAKITEGSAAGKAIKKSLPFI
jgi:hypothetical protein